MPKKSKLNRYSQILECIFFRHFEKSGGEFFFLREEIEHTAAELNIKLPKNVGDMIYTFRFRAPIPQRIVETAPSGVSWGIRLAGRGRYRFALAERWYFEATRDLIRIKVPNSTPGVIARYALDDEQALLALVRYNRLIDIFLGIASYSLQNHLRTSLKDIGQVETDEIYVGVDRHGVHYVVPVQAKGKSDRLNVVQIEQDYALCQEKFPLLLCQPVGAQFLRNQIIALQRFVNTGDGIRLADEKHYQLVPQGDLTEQDLASYRAALGA
jgi:hypothetical protein